MNGKKLIENIGGFFILTILLSCSEDKLVSGPTNQSDQFSVCNDLLPNCLVTTGEYCLFGYKWGLETNFDEVGVNSIGPKTTGGVVTYSFQEENGTIDTHRQIDLPSKSFDHLITCSKEEIRKALNAWSMIADIEFEELTENSASDIRVFVADIIQGGIGYPNFLDSPCTSIKGTVIIQTDLSIDNCQAFYVYALHEIGHVLGLGHVTSENVMNSDFNDYDFDGLQEGDKKGIIEIYGEK